MEIAKIARVSVIALMVPEFSGITDVALPAQAGNIAETVIRIAKEI